MSDKRIKYLIRISGTVLFASILLCLLIKDVGWTTHHRIVSKPGISSPQISPIFPVARTLLASDSWQIIDEPVYFTTRMSTMYDLVRVKLKYKNDCCHSIVVGLQTSSLGWDYKQELLDNQDFNNLDWDSLSMAGVILWSKESIKSNFTSLTQSLAGNDNVATYNFSTDTDFVIDNYSDYKQTLVVNVNIVDSYNMLVYVEDVLDIDFVFNKAGSTDFHVYDYSGNKLLIETSEQGSYKLLVENLQTGLYRIVVEPESGIVTSTIASLHKYINFMNQLYLVNNTYSLFTNASTIRWQSDDWSGLQTVVYAANELKIRKVGEKYYSRQLHEITHLNIPVGNIHIFGDGLFSFNDEYLLAAIPGKVSRIKSDSNYDYLIAKYNKTSQDNEWLINQVSFDLSEASINNGKLRFMIGALGASIANPLQIQEIEIIYEKKSDQETVWAEFIKYFKYWWTKVR